MYLRFLAYFTWEIDIQNNYFLNAMYATVENRVSVPGRAAQTLFININLIFRGM